MKSCRIAAFVWSICAIALLSAAGCSKPKPKPLGAACNRPKQCESKNCVGISKRGEPFKGICTIECKADGECAAFPGSVCDGAGAPAICRPPAGTKELGEACNAEASECKNGICLESYSRTGIEKYCSKPCVSDTDCGDAFFCKKPLIARSMGRENPHYCAKK